MAGLERIEIEERDAELIGEQGCQIPGLDQSAFHQMRHHRRFLLAGVLLCLGGGLRRQQAVGDQAAHNATKALCVDGGRSHG